MIKVKGQANEVEVGLEGMYIGGDTDITSAYLDLDDIKNFYSSYKEVAD